jgi:outer membrane immunogenic protein
MNKQLLYSFFAFAALTSSLFGADLPSRKDTPSFIIASEVNPSISWEGSYIGLNTGYFWSRNNRVDTFASAGPYDSYGGFAGESTLSANLATTDLDAKSRGLSLGAQFGYNVLFQSSWLMGLEADIVDFRNNSSSPITNVTESNVPLYTSEHFTSTTIVKNSVNWLSTFRARFGFIPRDNILVYFTGGGALGHVKAQVDIAQTDTGINSTYTGFGTTSGSLSSLRGGWALGSGLEWMLSPHWILKAEYLYYDLGSKVWNSADMVVNIGPFASPTYSAVNIYSNTRFSGNIARLGINYKF